MKKKLLGLGILLTAPPLLLILFVLLFAPFNGRTEAPTDYQSSPLLASPPPLWQETQTLRIVTFNIQDTYIVGQNRAQRMRAIADKLTQLNPDIVGFQEAFIQNDRELLANSLESSRLKHHTYFRSATVGSGLFIMSAFPIEETWFHRYPVANPWYKVWEGDWWAGKGVGLARIRLSENAYIDFYNTHAQAGYGNPHYDVVRTQQMDSLAQFLNTSRIQTVPAFLVGDMNCRIGDTDFETARAKAALSRTMKIKSKIDHIFSVDTPYYDFSVIKTLPIEEKVPLPNGETELSDHIGYLSEVKIQPQRPLRLQTGDVALAVPEHNAPSRSIVLQN